MRKKTTLTQIAKAAGVSISTVDRVLNERGGVSPRAEARVVEWAGKLNLDRVAFRKQLKLLRVAVLMQSPQNPFYQGLRDAFIHMNSAMADMNIRCFLQYVPATDIGATSRMIARIEQNYDAMIAICPEVPQLSDELKLISEKFPFVTLVTDLPDSGRLAYVGPNNRQTGRTAGELMGRFLGPDGGDVLIIMGLQKILGQEERETGFRAVLRERFPTVHVTASVESEESQSRAGKVVFSALYENPNIRGIYNISSGNTAILENIRKIGLAQKITLITHELTVERRKMLREGLIDAVIDQNPDIEAHRSLEILARHFGRLSPPLGAEFTPFNIYIRENV